MAQLSRRKRAAFYAILALVAYAMVEVASAGVYWILQGNAPSYATFTGERRAILAAAAVTGPSELGTQPIAPGIFEVLHPYLGFVLDPSRNGGFSEYGFPDGDLRLYPADPKRVVIAIFGGSFADQLDRMAKDTLAAQLAKSPRFAGKEIKVVGIATGGYKQPQQLLAFAWLLALGAHFDYVVTIDGFNEVALPGLENVPKGVFPFYPRNWVGRIGGHDAAMFEMAARHAQLQRERQELAAGFSRAPVRYSMTANVIWKARDQAIERRSQALNQEALAYRPASAALPYAVRGPAFKYADEGAMYDDLARMWKDASLQMNALARGNGIAYLHFLQPNQYVPGAKAMGEEERRAAIQPDHPYRAGVIAGYPRLQQRGRELAAAGVDFTDLTQVLAAHPEPLYADTCCHLSPQGYAIVARAIAERMVR